MCVPHRRIEHRHRKKRTTQNESRTNARLCRLGKKRNPYDFGVQHITQSMRWLSSGETPGLNSFELMYAPCNTEAIFGADAIGFSRHIHIQLSSTAQLMPPPDFTSTVPSLFAALSLCFFF